MESDHISLLRDLIGKLKSADPECRVFGSKKHRYQLGPALSEGSVAAFERTHEIQLPADYRAFVTNIGNGGAGPFYGLRPLSADSERELSKPFPFTVATDQLPDEEVEKTGYWGDFPGLIEVWEEGSGISGFLVVSGETYGTIWEGREDFFPTGLTFGAWYQAWLEKALLCLENEKYVPELRVGMSKDEVRNLIPADWSIRKAEQRPIWFLEASEIPAQLELDENEIVMAVKPWSFIVARPTR